jgi:hypothetical protein
VTVAVRVFEHVVRRGPLGLSLWDVARATHLADGLEIDVRLRARPEASVRAFANRSGIYCALGLPGLRGFELGEADDAAAWSATMRQYRIEVRDPQGRFLPFWFNADLPVRGLLGAVAPSLSPPIALPGLGSPPQLVIQGIPLVSAPSRPVPEVLAVVRAELREFGSERPAAWCLVTAAIGGIVCGFGISDRQGRVAVLFAHPEPPRPTLTSPPSANNDFRWNVELAVYYDPPPADAPVPDIADLAAVLAQAGHPRTLFRSVASPPQELPPLSLDYRVPLTVRTEAGPTGPSSYLYVETA